MISIVDEFKESYKAPPQLENLWDFEMEDWMTSNLNISKFKVITTSIPQLKLETLSHNTGHKYYSGFAMPESFSITFREDALFSVYRYFKRWEREIFDVEKGVFISSRYPKTRAGVLKYSTFVLNADARRLFEISTMNKIENIAKQAQETVFTRVENVATQIPGIAMPYSKQLFGSQLSSLAKKTGLTEISSTIGSLFEEVVTYQFNFIGIRYLGISDFTPTYDSQNELTITVDFSVDSIIGEEGDYIVSRDEVRMPSGRPR